MTQAISKHQLLAGIILDYTTKYPERHNQQKWVSGDFNPNTEKPGCGTTGCVAGYTVLFTNDSRFNLEKDSWTDEYTIVPSEGTRYASFKDAGREHLGLSEADASVLFFHTTEQQARDALAYLARGEKIDWYSIIENFDPSNVWNEWERGERLHESDFE